MLLYDAEIPVSLIEFGIEIPLADSRASSAFAALSGDPGLATNRPWHRSRVDRQLLPADLRRAHAPAYVSDLYAGSERLTDHLKATFELVDADGNYHRYSPHRATRPLNDLFDRILLQAAGTFQCGQLALAHGFCYYFSGGMHHAHHDHGSGFCLINDVAIAARKLQAEGRVDTVWVIDTDAHKGDGTAAITAGDATIQTLSIHMARGWPLDGPPILADGNPNPAYAPSDIDIPIAVGEEAAYLERLDAGLRRLAAAGPADLAIVVSGADACENDALASTAGLGLSLEQMLTRDQLVYRFLKGQQIPMAFLMAGGYGEAVWRVYAQFLSWALRQEGWGV